VARPNYPESRFPFPGSRWQTPCLVWLVLVAAAQATVRADDKTEFFENEIRPLLVEKCSRCHGAKKQSGGLRIDSREALMKGGDGGSAILPGDPTSSLIVQAVRRKGELKMPPDNPLSAREIRSLEKWIELRAPWPASTATLPSVMAYRASNHWAFQPVEKPQIPDVEIADWIRTPVDAFVLARLQEAGLTPSLTADQRTLIRRAYYALTGLPPSPEEVERFVNDPDPKAYERLVDRLLDSPHYGEQ
jgi:hypothetical protein